MAWTPLRDRLDQLPLILAGPMLRRTQPDEVTVWVALKDSCVVTLAVFDTQQGAIVHNLILAGIRATVALGDKLHVVAVTARSVDHRRLQSGQIYAYDLSFERFPPETEDRERLTLNQALHSSVFPQIPISYFDHQLPTFALSPQNLNQLKIVHGSCRKAHGGEQDTLPILDSLIEHSKTEADQRPHQLFLTGDQVYGDDVADALLCQLTDAGDTLLGWEEALPVAEYTGMNLPPSRLRPGQRSQAAEQWAGFTAGLAKKPECDRSHLFGLGEYCAIYLFAWSQVLWSDPLPEVEDIGGTKAQKRYWHKEQQALQDFVYTLWKVRRALANIPTYMIFDDHDISDDWYLNQAWCLRVLGKPLGRRTVQNGLLAYAIFQAWGNTPEQFRQGKVGEQLLVALEEWSASAGADEKASQQIACYLGLPAANPVTGLPEMRRDGSVLVLDRDAQSLRWHYTVRGDRHEVLVLDTRTWRGYPAGTAPPNAPPMLLSPTAFERQIHKGLYETDLLNKQRTSKIEATLIVAPTNLVSLRLIDWIQHFNLQQGDTFKNDVGDAWNIHKGAFSQLLAALFERRDRIIVLSGDIHYGSVVRLEYWSSRFTSVPLSTVENQLQTTCPKVLVQVTASAIKNSELKTRIVHTKLKSLLPEYPQDWMGWDTPHVADPEAMEDESLQWGDRAVKRPTSRLRRLLLFLWQRPAALLHKGTKAIEPSAPPDWRYRIIWLKRQPAQTAEWGQFVPWLRSSHPRSKWATLRHRLFDGLWKNRWLQEGKEVVGRNNLGLVQMAEQDANYPQRVTQDLYWYPSWRKRSVVFSRFSASLERQEKPED